jgi:hypothetical protein
MFKICGCDRRAQYTRTQTNSVVKERYHEESTWETDSGGPSGDGSVLKENGELAL